MSKKRQLRHFDDFDSNFDPNGSYTGKTKSGEKPIQDADDL